MPSNVPLPSALMLPFTRQLLFAVFTLELRQELEKALLPPIPTMAFYVLIMGGCYLFR